MINDDDKKIFDITNNGTNMILNRIDKKKIRNIKDYQDTEPRTEPRYGTTVNLATNKVTDTTDKHLTRDKLLPQELESDIFKKYRISRINIDSRFRNINPSNIISKTLIVSKPFTIAKNSNILQITMPQNHGINVDNIITISNLIPLRFSLRANCLSLKKNTKYLYINEINHNFIGDNNIIRILNVQNAIPNNYFFGNIPLTVINDQHNVILIYNNGILDKNNYMVDLSIFSDDDYVYNENSVDIDVITINGINIKYINSSYPITNDIVQGYQTVTEVGKDYIKIQLSQFTNLMTPTTGLGSDNIFINLISGTQNGYPEPDYYKFELKKTYYKVKKIRLVSTEIPNTEMLIKSSTSRRNNKLYWEIRDDGAFLYSITISPGNYDAISLQYEINKQINKTLRNFGSYFDKNLYMQNCIANVTINSYNNLFSMGISSTIILSSCLSKDTITTYPDNSTRINVTHPYHNLNPGDQITISNAINVLDSTVTTTNPDGTTTSIKYYVPINVINTVQIVESVTGINNYIIKLTKYNSSLEGGGPTNINNGGNAVNILYPLTIRLRFDKSDTIGNILGYLNVGDTKSLTVFNKTITNNTLYLNSSNLNSVGLTNENSPILNFTTFPYILMVSDMFSNNINYKDSTGVFAKLFLTGNPGSIIYDQYIQITEDIPASVSYLNEFEFKFITSTGDQYHFNGQDHSYTLEIYEELTETNDNVINVKRLM